MIEIKEKEREHIIESIREEVKLEEKTRTREENEREKMILSWVPKTELGKKVFNKEIESLEELFESGLPVKEPEIIDYLSEIQEKIVSIRKTTKVARSGRKFRYSAALLIGNGSGFIGIGRATDKERWNAIRKASKDARLNLIHIRRGCGSWECSCNNKHSIPFKVEGKSASVKLELIPAPKGVGLVTGDNIKDVMRFSGIQDIWSKSFGSSDTKLNFVRTAINALKKTTKQRISNEMKNKIEISEKSRG